MRRGGNEAQELTNVNVCAFSAYCMFPKFLTTNTSIIEPKLNLYACVVAAVCHHSGLRGERIILIDFI